MEIEARCTKRCRSSCWKINRRNKQSHAVCCPPVVCSYQSINILNINMDIEKIFNDLESNQTYENELAKRKLVELLTQSKCIGES